MCHALRVLFSFFSGSKRTRLVRVGHRCPRRGEAGRAMGKGEAYVQQYAEQLYQLVVLASISITLHYILYYIILYYIILYYI